MLTVIISELGKIIGKCNLLCLSVFFQIFLTIRIYIYIHMHSLVLKKSKHYFQKSDTIQPFFQCLLVFVLHDMFLHI